MLFGSGAGPALAVLIVVALTWKSVLAQDDFSSLQKRGYPTSYFIPSKVFAFGRPCTDRNYWYAIRSVPNNNFNTWKRWADNAVQSGLPPWIETLYRYFQTRGTREGDGMMKSRTFRNYGKNPEKYFVDLHVASWGAQLSHVHYMLGSQLRKQTADLLLCRINERVLTPSSKETIVKAAVDAVPYYMMSFTDEGFNQEGVSYFSYGFGMLSLLRETLLQASNKVLDLFADEKVSIAALFPLRYPMRGGVQAAFADSGFNQQVSAALIAYLKWAYKIENVKPAAPSSGLHSHVLLFVMNTFGLGDRTAPFKLRSLDPSPLRTHFDQADTVVMRGQPLSQPLNSRARLDMTIKGGGNGAHSYNDLGSYAIALDGVVVLGDPGGPSYYNATTLSK
ncbi:hypothetical protein HDU96_001268 [Phlyctochytrium bullatum]|nr:hypothetical protein HDU96_001268 [Phlyctochytrium bullatum]